MYTHTETVEQVCKYSHMVLWDTLKLILQCNSLNHSPVSLLDPLPFHIYEALTSGLD